MEPENILTSEQAPRPEFDHEITWGVPGTHEDNPAKMTQAEIDGAILQLGIGEEPANINV